MFNFNPYQIDTSQSKQLFAIPEQLPKRVKTYCFAMQLQYHQAIIMLSEDRIIALAFSNKEQKLVLADEWIFKKVKSAQKLIKNYFYITTTDNKIGLFQMKERVVRKISIQPLTEMMPYQSYFQHQVRTNVMEIHIFKSQHELKVCQFTSNNKYKFGQMTLANAQGNTYKIQKQQKNYLFSSKNFVNTARKIILSKSSAKTQKLIITHFPQQLNLILGIAGKQEYIAFTNKFQYFNPFMPKTITKVHVLKDYSKFVPQSQGMLPKINNLYIRNNSIIMSLQNSQINLIISLSAKGVPKIVGRQYGKYDTIIFGVDHSQLIGIFNKNTLKKTIVKMKQINVVSNSTTHMKRPQIGSTYQISKTTPNITNPSYGSVTSIMSNSINYPNMPKQPKKQYSLKSENSSKQEALEQNQVKEVQKKNSGNSELNSNKQQKSGKSIDSQSPDKFFVSETNQRTVYVNQVKKSNIFGKESEKSQNIGQKTKGSDTKQDNIIKKQQKNQQKQIAKNMTKDAKDTTYCTNPFKQQSQHQTGNTMFTNNFSFAAKDAIIGMNPFKKQSQHQIDTSPLTSQLFNFDELNHFRPRKNQTIANPLNNARMGGMNPFNQQPNSDPFSALFLPKLKQTVTPKTQAINSQKVVLLTTEQKLFPIKHKILECCEILDLSTKKFQQSMKTPTILEINPDKIIVALKQNIEKQYSNKGHIDLNKFKGKIHRFTDMILTNNFMNTGNLLKKQNEVIKKNTLKMFYPQSFLHTSNEQFMNRKQQYSLKIQNSKLETKDNVLDKLNEWGKSINQINNVIQDMKEEVQDKTNRINQMIAVRQEFGKQIDLIKQELQKKIAEKLQQIQNKAKIKSSKINKIKNVKTKNEELFINQGPLFKQKHKKSKKKARN